jgi:hypothetical protein
VIDEATRHRKRFLQRQQLKLCVVDREPLGAVAEPLPVQQADDHAKRLVLPAAKDYGVDTECSGIRGQGARSGAEDDPSVGQVIELHHPLGNIEGMMIGERHHAGAEPDALCSLPGRRKEYLGRSDRLPSGGVVLSAPYFVKAETIEMDGEVQIAA